MQVYLRIATLFFFHNAKHFTEPEQRVGEVMSTAQVDFIMAKPNTESKRNSFRKHFTCLKQILLLRNAI